MHKLSFTLMATIYRLLQRIVVLDISKLTICRIHGESEKAAVHTDADFRFISSKDVLRHAEDPELDLESEMAGRLDAGLDKCAGAFVDGKLVGYLWIAFQGIEAEHNSGKHANSGIAVSFDEDSAFLYKGYLKRAFRKQGLSCLLAWTAEQLSENYGISQLISTTEWLNVPAYRALSRGGFELIGHTCRAIVFGIPIEWGPRQAAKHGICLGKDAVVPTRQLASTETSHREDQLTCDDLVCETPVGV